MATNKLLNSGMAAAILIAVSALAAPQFAIAATQTCIKNFHETHETCVWWEETTAPVEGVDYDLSYASAGDKAPDVDFKNGDHTWHVYTYDYDTPLAPPPGDLGRITAETGDDFTIHIRQPAGGVGAANVEEIDLTPSGNHYSILGSSLIKGDVGAITAQEYNGNGGAVSLESEEGDLTGNVTAVEIVDLNIAGNFTGDVTVTTLSYMYVGGNLTGDITAPNVDTIFVVGDYSGAMDIDTLDSTTATKLTVKGDVSSTSEIVIEDMERLSKVNIEGDLAGDVVVTNLDFGSIYVHGTVESTALVQVSNLIHDPEDPEYPAWIFMEFCDANNPITSNPPHSFDGQLLIESAIPDNTVIALHGKLTSGGVIDLDGNDIEGALWLIIGGSGTITDVADLKNEGWYGIPPTLLLTGEDNGDFPFSGTVNVENVSAASSIWTGYSDFEGALQIHGDMAGEILILDEGLSGNLDGSIIIDGQLTGTIEVDEDATSSSLIEVWDDVSGDITIHGTADGEIDLTRVNDLTMGGSITLNNGSADVKAGILEGEITLAVGNLEQAFNGQLYVGETVSGSEINTLDGAELGGSGEIKIGRDHAGTVVISGRVDGDIIVEEDSLGDITLESYLNGTGRILVDGVCDGTISVANQTDSGSLIRLLDGLEDNGQIVINADEGPNNAGGRIEIGVSNLGIFPPPPLSQVIFDGAISIHDETGTGNGGDLDGDIRVFGCHATSDDLSICIDGSDNGNVDIYQGGCSNQVTWSCP